MEDTNTQIKETVESHPIVLYIKGTREEPQCGFSNAVIQIFQKLNVPFETVDVLSDPAIREGVKEFTKWPTVPQVFIKGEFIGGCDIVKDLYTKGELEPMVKKALG